MLKRVEATGNGIILKCGKNVNRFTAAREEQDVTKYSLQFVTETVTNVTESLSFVKLP